MNCFINKKLSLLLVLVFFTHYLFTQKTIDNCTFDIKTQDDNFLKNIEELKDYKWDQKNKTATIDIYPNETIKIYRGGCNHFLLKAEFLVPKTFTFEKNKEYIFKRILWISKLIYDDEDFVEIEKCILKKHITIDQSNTSYVHINLLSNKIYNSYTIFYNTKGSVNNIFSIEYFIN